MSSKRQISTATHAGVRAVRVFLTAQTTRKPHDTHETNAYGLRTAGSVWVKETSEGSTSCPQLTAQEQLPGQRAGRHPECSSQVETDQSPEALSWNLLGRVLEKRRELLRASSLGLQKHLSHSDQVLTCIYERQNSSRPETNRPRNSKLPEE